jgi:hypothetical protein
MAMVGIRFDLRVPSFAKATHAEMYRACLDQSEWADRLGLDIVVLSEHHGVDDGFMSSPVTLAAAIAGRTKNIQINIAAVLVPLHDPVRLAEQLATAALVSGGRIGFVAGLGYRHEEFEMAGVDRKRRGTLLEEAVEVMRRAWTGEPFEWRGRTIRVTPAPPSPPMILIGDQRLADLYAAECERVGFRGGFVSMPNGPGFVHVSENPERDWQRIAPHVLYDAQTYASWQTPDQRSQMHVEGHTLDDVKRSGAYTVLTPDDTVKLAEETGRVILHPLMGGMDPALGWESLRLFEEKVLPRIR